jgi:hypothetical protein
MFILHTVFNVYFQLTCTLFSPLSLAEVHLSPTGSFALPTFPPVLYTVTSPTINQKNYQDRGLSCQSYSYIYPTFSVRDPDDGGSKLHLNASQYAPDHTA